MTPDTSCRIKIDPMKDTPSKVATQYHSDFSKYLFQTFLGLTPEELEGVQPSDANFLGIVHERHENSYKELTLSADNLFRLADGSQIIIEVQRKFQNDFLLRLELYAIKAISKQFDRIDSRIKVHDRYGLLTPLYVLAIVKGKYFKDDIICRELNDGFPLPFREGEPPKKMIRIVLVEIDKYDLGNFKSDDEKGLLEFFLNRPYSSPQKGSLLKAVDAIVSNDKDWKVEERMNWLKEQEIREEVREEVRKESLAEGRAEGAETKALETARKMIRNGFSNDEVIEYTDLSFEKITQLRNELTPSGV